MMRVPGRGKPPLLVKKASPGQPKFSAPGLFHFWPFFPVDRGTRKFTTESRDPAPCATFD